MKCEDCGQDATVHDVKIENGQPADHHYCVPCAKKRGLEGQSHEPAGTLLAKAVLAVATGLAPEKAQAAKVAVCGKCGLTYAQFRNTGQLGCGHCYKAFEEQLSPLLSRSHEGGTHHVGKFPRRAAGLTAPAAAVASELAAKREEILRRVGLLRKKLDEALIAEHYERAAQIRDELRRLGAEPAGPTRHDHSGAERASEREGGSGPGCEGEGGGGAGGGGGGARS